MPDFPNPVDVVIFLLLLLLLVAPLHAGVKVELTPTDQDLEKNLLAHLSFKDEACDAPRWRLRRLVKGADEDIGAALRAFGYYRPGIEKELTFDENCWQAVLRVDAGPRVTVRERDIRIGGELADDEGFTGLLESLPLSPGSPLNHAQYESIKTRLRNFAAERGYLDFRIDTQQLRVNPSLLVADIIIHGKSGPRYRIGDYEFSTEPLDDAFLQRLADIKPGEPFDARKLIEINRNLNDSGYFSRVQVTPRRRDAKDGVVPLDIDMQMAPRHKWKAGVGYSTDFGPRLTLGYENRYLNEFGRKFASEIRLSPVDSGLTADYIIPGEDPHRSETIYGLRILNENTVSANTKSVALAGRWVKETGDWTRTLFVELSHERSEIAGEENEATLLMPGIALNHTEADNLVRVNRGHRLNLEARVAHEALLSSESLVQVRARAKLIHRLDNWGRVSVRGDAGFTFAEELDNLPTSLRFFAGGDNSVRGYEYESLGPTDKNGDVTGGRHLLTLSGEYEYPVAGEDWWAAGFIDAGNAFETQDIQLKVGYGLGVRWYSPVGRVRLDLAFPREDPRDDWRIHFGLGTDL